jgi:hypothetical protein
MSNAVFPAAIRGLTYATRKAMEFATIIQTAPNFATTRIQQTRNPIWHFTLLYEYLFDDPTNLAGGLTQTDLRTMMGFIMARGGQFDDFLFTDPDDNFSGPALISAAPNTLAQLQVVTDGAGNYYSPVQRNLGGFYGTSPI